MTKAQLKKLIKSSISIDKRIDQNADEYEKLEAVQMEISDNVHEHVQDSVIYKVDKKLYRRNYGSMVECEIITL